MELSRIARGGTPITLDRPRLLFFDMAALWLLIQKYGQSYLQALYGAASTEPGKSKDEALGLTFVLKSMDALQFYLWVGLQADCTLRGEELTLEQVGELITPFTFPKIFETVLTALFRDTLNPARKGEDPAGKADAAAARPAVVAEARPTQRKRSTSKKKSASPSGRSAGRPVGFGPRR